MASYLITGASRGIGFAFLENISSDPAKTVIALVRNKADLEPKIAGWNRTNIHIIQGDLVDIASLQRAAEETAKITGGSLDYLIANAGVITRGKEFASAGELGQDPVAFEAVLIDLFRTNCIGNIHLFNMFTPLILKGKIKKVIAISSGLADIEPMRTFNFTENPPYAISKAALNAAVAKFSAEYAKQGVLFISICPGPVDTGSNYNRSEEEGLKQMELGKKFLAYAPHFKGPATPEHAVKDVLSVAEKASVANGDGGSFVSRHGNKEWV